MKKAKRIVIILASLVFAAVSTVMIIWYVKYHIVYKPLLDTNKFVYVPEHEAYEYHDGKEFSEDIYVSYYKVFVPKFLQFYDESIPTVSVRMPNNIKEKENGTDTGSYRYGDISINFRYAKTLFGKQQFVWEIYDTSGETSSSEGIIENIRIYTDDKLNFEYEESDVKTSLTYENCYDYMKDFYKVYLTDMIGEDYFPPLNG